MKKKIKEIKYYIVLVSNIIFGTPIFIILLLLNNFIKIRIARLYSSRIGHLTLNVDNYIGSKKNKKDYEFSIFICENSIANKDIFKRWNKLSDILLTKNFLMKNLIGFLEKFFLNSKFIIPSDELLNDYNFSLTSCSEINLWIDKDKERKREIKSFFNQLGIKQPYVCLHNRDSAYIRNNKGINDPNYHPIEPNFRDFEFDDYSKSIKFLHQNNIQPIRVGEIVEKENSSENTDYFSATGRQLSSKYIIELVNNSEFLVTGNSGISHVSRVIRKPMLLINFAPLIINITFHVHPANSIIMPKKILNLENNKLLSIKEASELPHYTHGGKDFFRERNLKVINNTQEEISEAIMEMYLHVNNKWQDDEIQSRLQSKFWKSIESYKNYNGFRYKLKTRLSSTFLKRNPELVD